MGQTTGKVTQGGVAAANKTVHFYVYASGADAGTAQTDGNGNYGKYLTANTYRAQLDNPNPPGAPPANLTPASFVIPSGSKIQNLAC